MLPEARPHAHSDLEHLCTCPTLRHKKRLAGGEGEREAGFLAAGHYSYGRLTAFRRLFCFIRSAMEAGIPADSPNLVLLFFLAQLFLRELYKSKNLVRVVPMDMTGYFGESLGCSSTLVAN